MKNKCALGLLLSVFFACFAMVASAGATTYSFTSTEVVAGNPFAWQGALDAPTAVPMGDKTLSDVTLATTFNYYAAPITPAQFTLTTVGTPALDPGFVLNAVPLSTQALGSQDATLAFVVTAPTTAPIVDVSLSFVGGILPKAASAASATVTEFVYTNSAKTTLLGTLTVGETGLTFIPSAVVNFAPQTSIYVVKDMSVQGDGAPGAAAFISQVTQNFSEVPVPPSVLLFAPGLLGLVGMRKRLRG